MGKTNLSLENSLLIFSEPFTLQFYRMRIKFEHIM